jgi:putative copper resistance protein D
MLPLIVIGARLAQFACAMILFGTPLFFLYGLPARGGGSAQQQSWPVPLLRRTAALLLASALVFLFAQAAVMADSVAEAFKPDTLATVLTDGHFGLAIIARQVLTVLALLIVMFLRPSQRLWVATTVLGAGIVATFAWTGHGASNEGPGGLVHLTGDVLHLLAAAIWVGALVAFALLLFHSSNATGEELQVLHRALTRFSGMGAAVVAILLATGLINSWFLVGPSHVWEITRSAYGQVLLAKLFLFTIMLGLAAANRFLLTPRLGAVLAAGAPTGAAVATLRRSVVTETSAAFIVLALVSLLGTLAPPISQ